MAGRVLPHRRRGLPLYAVVEIREQKKDEGNALFQGKGPSACTYNKAFFGFDKRLARAQGTEAPKGKVMRLTRPLLIFPYLSPEDSEIKRATVLTKFYNDICEYYETREAHMATPELERSDNWKHRSVGMRCTTCMFFVKKESDRAADNERGVIGRCRRHAPELGGWPAVYAMDWCGDHKIDENKI